MKKPLVADLEVRAELDDGALATAVQRMVVVTINSCLLWLIVSSSHYPLGDTWIVISIAISAVRFVLEYLFLQDNHTGWLLPQPYRNIGKAFSVTIGGAVWGSACLVFFDPSMPLETAVVVFIVVGMAAAGTFVYSMESWKFIPYLFATLLPLVYVFLASDMEHKIEFTMLSIMYMIGMINSAKSNQSLAQKYIDQSFVNEERAVTAQQLADRLQIIVDHMPFGLVRWDEAKRIKGWNPAAEEIFGYHLEDVADNYQIIYKDKGLSDKLQRRIDQLFTDGLSFAGVAKNITRQQEEILCQWSHEPLLDNDGKVTEVISFVEDVTERVQDSEAANHRAYYDMLTGLPNRQSFHLWLSELRAGLEYAGKTHGVLLLDIDNFKTINDTRGHDYGDEVLIAFGRRLQDLLGDKYKFARLGGDEFVVLMLGLGEDREAANSAILETANQLIEDSNNKYDIFDEGMYVELSIGATLFTESEEDSDILKAADLALYAMKSSGRNGYRMYEESMLDEMQQEMLLLKDLKDAVRNDEFEPYFQPIFNTNDDSVAGVEVLLRWYKEGEIVAADKFIDVLEESTLISKVSCSLIDKVCAIIADWQQQGVWSEGMVVYFNLSPIDLRHDDFINQFLQSCQQYQLSPTMFDFELTERELFQQVDRFQDIMKSLKDAGAKLTIDDFGTGYASLGYIKNMPVDSLKIDRMFIADMVTSKDDYMLVKAILSICEALDLECVAEGVENMDQLAMLKQLSSDKYQGYYPCIPLDQAAFAQWVQESNPVPGSYS